MTTANSPSKPNTPEAGFVANLADLDRGELAKLRRNAGNSLAEARDVLGLFYRILPPSVPEGRHERYFTVATLYPLAKSGDDRNFGASLRRARTETNQRGLDRRFAALLDADSRQLPFRLRQLIRFADSNRVGVNWPQLLRDVIAWDRQDRRTQKEWAMAYVHARSEHEDDQPEEDRFGTE